MRVIAKENPQKRFEISRKGKSVQVNSFICDKGK